MKFKDYIINEQEKLPKGAKTFYHTDAASKAQGFGSKEMAVITSKVYDKNVKPFDRDWNFGDDEVLVFWYVSGAVAGGRPGWSSIGIMSKRKFKKEYGFMPK